MRRIVSVLFLVVATFLGPASLLSVAQQPFAGRIIDAETGKPIAGATVTIPGFTAVAQTDADGRFTWGPPPAVPFQVVVVLPGGSLAQPVQISSIAEPAEIRITPFEEEAVTVIGTAPSITASPGAATTMMSSTQISSRLPENLMQALETVPGVNVVSEGHATVPAIRGLARGRTLVLIDGGRVTSERRVGPSATFADPAAFERIDVARGPGSVAYGSDALGGVVSVRTRRAQPGTPFRISGSGTWGGGIPQRRGTVEVSQGFERGGVLLQAHAREADDWDSPVGDGSVFNSGWKDRGFLGRFDHQLGRGLFSAGWQSDFGRDIERPRNNSRTVRFFYPYENSHRLTSSYEVADVAGLQQLTITGFFGTFDQRTDQDRFPTATTGRSIERADVSAKDFHVKASGTRNLARTRVEFGVDVNGRYGLEAIDTNIRYATDGSLIEEQNNLSVDSARRIDLGVYAQGDVAAAEVVRLSAGLRADRVTTKNVGGFFGDRDTSNGAFSGFAAVTVGPFSGLSFTGQVARGFRDPTLSDRYFRGPSGRGFITGNPDLDPESSLQFDLGTHYTVGRTQIGAYVYHYRITDLVERYQTDPDFFFFRNRGRAQVRGFELEARSDLGGGLAVEAGLNIGRGKALDGDTPLDDISADTLFVLARKTFTDRIWAQARASVTADDDRPGPSEIEAPGATVIDLSAGWRVTRALELRGIIRNLLDDDYFASPDPRWVYAPGRSGSLTLGFRF